MAAVGKVVRFSDTPIQKINCIISNTLINDTISNIARECTNVLHIHDTVKINDISTQIHNFYKSNLKNEKFDINLYIFTSCVDNKSHALFVYNEEESGVGLECLTFGILQMLHDENIRYVNIFAIIRNLREEDSTNTTNTTTTTTTVNYNLQNIEAMEKLITAFPNVVTNLEFIILDGTSTFNDTFQMIKEDLKQSLKTGLNVTNRTNLLKKLATKLNRDISQLSSVVY